jgi:hypothetical protein
MWKAPFTSGAPCTLPAGTILIADHDQIRTAPGFACVPEAYEELEPVLAPPEDRAHPKYNGYYLVLLADKIGEWLVGAPLFVRSVISATCPTICW